MSINPYQPPQTPAEPPPADDRDRSQARIALRLSLVILLFPALFNYYAFDMQAIAGGRIPAPIALLFRVTNLSGFAIGATAIWFLGLPLLERLSQVMRKLFANSADSASWNAALYKSLRPAAYLAIAGAMLWTLWVIGFYYLGIHFVVISWLVGVPAHLLGACLYVPLLWRWYRLAT